MRSACHMCRACSSTGPRLISQRLSERRQVVVNQHVGKRAQGAPQCLLLPSLGGGFSQSLPLSGWGSPLPGPGLPPSSGSGSASPEPPSSGSSEGCDGGDGSGSGCGSGAGDGWGSEGDGWGPGPGSLPGGRGGSTGPELPGSSGEITGGRESRPSAAIAAPASLTVSPLPSLTLRPAEPLRTGSPNTLVSDP